MLRAQRHCRLPANCQRTSTMLMVAVGRTSKKHMKATRQKEVVLKNREFTLEAVDFTTMRKRKCLFVSGCWCNSTVSTQTPFLTSCRGGIYFVKISVNYFGKQLQFSAIFDVAVISHLLFMTRGASLTEYPSYFISVKNVPGLCSSTYKR